MGGVVVVEDEEEKGRCGRWGLYTLRWILPVKSMPFTALVVKEYGRVNSTKKQFSRENCIVYIRKIVSVTRVK